MNDKCIKHGEYPSFGNFQCPMCKESEERGFIWFSLVAIALLLLLIGGVKLVWAKVVYDDYRCVFSECRIIKN